ncbi:MAG: TlpA family protein disulfide reductase [Rhizomicrobium sp.]
MKTLLHAASLIAILSSSAMAIAADGSIGPAAVDGRWDAVLSRNGTEIPFRLDIKGEGPTLKGVFYNGFTPYDGTTGASFHDGKLVLDIEQYLTTISATLSGGELTGSLVAENRGPGGQYVFTAVRHVNSHAMEVRAPAIAGSWIIPLDVPSSKGERALRFIVRQRGDEVAAAILRIDGDTGSYSGTYKDGKWVLSHFDGGRPGVIVVAPKPDGTLEIRQHANRPAAGKADGSRAPVLIAYRAAVAEAKGLPRPDDFLRHTTPRDPGATFKFAFPDAHGRLVTNHDLRFKGKVVLAVISGTWCPNCHDEAQYLVQLDKRYRSKGLAVVDFDFEEPDQQGSLEREQAFAKRYGVKYTTLLAGAPSELHEKVPELKNLDTWPATMFIGRDGKVKAVHAGFASPASGKFYADLKREFTTRIEHLLAEKAPADASGG